MNVIYLWGYQGRSVSDLHDLARDRDAYVVDIRFSPFTKQAGWGKAELSDALGWRYQWCRELGNRNYKGGEIEISDLKSGMERVSRLAAERPVILFCACGKPEHCHRTVVSLAFRAAGYEVEELRPTPEPEPSPQMGLF